MCCCFWLTVSKYGAPTLNTAFLLHFSYKMVSTLASDIFQFLCYLTQLQFSVVQMFSGTNAEFGRLEHISIICACATVFKVTIPPLNCYHWWRKVWITLVNPLLCLNSILSQQKVMFNQCTNVIFIYCFPTNKSYLTKNTISSELNVKLSWNFDTNCLRVTIIR